MITAGRFNALPSELVVNRAMQPTYRDARTHTSETHLFSGSAADVELSHPVVSQPHALCLPFISFPPASGDRHGLYQCSEMSLLVR